MGNVAELARRIKRMSMKQTELSDMLFGKVISTSPLTIQIDPKLILTEEFLVLSETVRGLTIPVEVDGKKGTAVYHPLAVGDTVKLMRISQGKKYYVIERGG